MATAVAAPGGGPAPVACQLEDLLAANEFSAEFIAALRERARKEFSLEALENYPLLQNAVVGWIGERIDIDPPLRFAGKGTQILIIVGPTGVGKTTTIAKLAAIYGIGDGRQPPRRVRIITIDNYRIAAKQQIETYAEIMRIPVSLVESAADLQKNLALYQDTDLILVDTIGRSPRDLAKLAEMKEILAACGSQAASTSPWPPPPRRATRRRSSGSSSPSAIALSSSPSWTRRCGSATSFPALRVTASPWRISATARACPRTSRRPPSCASS